MCQKGNGAVAQNNKGLPIGNLTSQVFSKVYLNKLNQFVKHTFKCKPYISYVDDFIWLHKSQKQQSVWQAETENFIDTKLKLKLKPEQILKPTSAGADFLSYIVKLKYKLVRNSVYRNLRKKPEQHQKDIIIDNNSQIKQQWRQYA
jgi:hypothetical protein